MLIPLGILAASGAGGGGSYESIASATTSNSIAEFTSIANTYKHLQIRGTFDSSGNSVLVQFNNDTAGNYVVHALYGDGSSPSAVGTTGSSRAVHPDIFYGGFPSSSYRNVFIIDIIDYASTSKYKTVRTFSGLDSNGGTAPYIGLGSGLWQSTSAISSIKFNTNTTGTFALYGLKGA